MKLWLTLVLSLLLVFPPVYAQDELELPNGFFSVQARRNHKRTNNYVAYPALSYFLPGFAQYKYGQYGAGLTYSTMGAVGLGVGIHAINALGEQPTIEDLDTTDWRVRQTIWGFKTYDLAGSLSAYHAFRTSVAGRASERFDFLGEAETTGDLMIAPARLDYFTRWTTLIPLALITGGLVAYMANDDYNTDPVYGSDLLFSTALSFNAGVGEEALFRGFLMPVLTDVTKSPFYGNLATAGIFALAHVSEANPVPFPQFILGYYFGWLAQQNNWTLSEVVFLHTWWDIIVFSFAFSRGDPKANIYVPLYQTQF